MNVTLKFVIWLSAILSDDCWELMTSLQRASCIPGSAPAFIPQDIVM